MCNECAMVKERAGMWHAYQANCDGCTARAVARSAAMFAAVRLGEPRNLREMIGRVLPGMSYADARVLVWKAWEIDHAEQEEANVSHC